MNLHGAFTPQELQQGLLCYSFSFRRDPALHGAKGPLGKIGTVCEGCESTEYLEPTE
jgi:hypothetical protein